MPKDATTPIWLGKCTTQGLAEITGYKISGSFNAMLAHLRAIGVIDRQNGVITATSLLFPENLT